MITKIIQARNGTAVIAPGEILRMTGHWTGAEITRLLWQLEFMEGG